jgi:putative ABC transport system permease protein
MTSKQPPRAFLRFFRWFCHPDLHPFVEGDLLELYQERRKESGKKRADIKFIIDVLLLFRPGIIKPANGYYQLNNFAMLKNYIKVGFRNILKYKTFSSINIFGLAMSMSICLLIILMFADQKSYDQFHTKKDRIFRVLMKPVNNNRPYATVPYPIASTIKSDYPVAKDATTLLRGFGGDAVHDQKFAEMKGYFADESFFNIFDYELEFGDPSKALEKPNSIVISHEIAEKLFGQDDPTGEVIHFSNRGTDFWTDESGPAEDWGSYAITGVFAKTGYKSHLEFDALASSSSLPLLYSQHKLEDLSGNWTNYWRSYTYVLLDDNKEVRDLTNCLDQIASGKFAQYEDLSGSGLIPQPLSNITPGPALGNAPSTSLPSFVFYILGILAVVIMFSAIVNYANLSIARAVTRSKEIGVRKVVGARRKNLIIQFISESMITSLLAMLLANVFLLILKLAFLNLWINQYLNVELKAQIYVYFLFLAFALMIGLLTGFFPALHLSKFSPVSIMKKGETTRASKLGVRKILTGLQFIVSLVFIITSIVIYHQFKFLTQFEYGFNAQNVININLQSNAFEQFRNEFGSSALVKKITGCAYIPATGRNDGVQLGIPGTEKTVSSIDFWADENFTDLLDINLVAGRNLPPAVNDSNSFILVNEQAAMDLGYNYPGKIVGEMLSVGNTAMEVVGVFENFNLLSPISKRKTGPIVVRNEPSLFKYAMIKVDPSHKHAVAELKKMWKKIDPIHPLEYEYYEERLANNNRGIFDVVTVIGLLAFLAITIACLGLLGMAIYTTERRTKEIGIRKVLGANDIALVFLLSKEFLIILSISVAIAAPASYLLNNLWLQFLVFRVDIGFGTILFGSGILLILGLISIGPQTFKVSNGNPVDSLRME